MRLSSEKQVQLAQLVAKRMLASKDGVQAKASEVIIRTKALETIRAFVKCDEQMLEAQDRTSAWWVPRGPGVATG